MRYRLLVALVLLWSCTLLAAAPPLQQAYTIPALDVPYVPTQPGMVEQMLKLADVRKTDTVYDLGCGDGRIVIMAAEKFAERGVDFHLNPGTRIVSHAFDMGDWKPEKHEQSDHSNLFLWTVPPPPQPRP
jgi:hypothetical protein